MRSTMDELSDEELTELVAAGETMGRLIETLQQRAPTHDATRVARRPSRRS